MNRMSIKEIFYYILGICKIILLYIKYSFSNNNYMIFDSKKGVLKGSIIIKKR